MKPRCLHTRSDRRGSFSCPSTTYMSVLMPRPFLLTIHAFLIFPFTRRYSSAPYPLSLSSVGSIFPISGLYVSGVTIVASLPLSVNILVLAFPIFTFTQLAFSLPIFLICLSLNSFVFLTLTRLAFFPVCATRP